MNSILFGQEVNRPDGFKEIKKEIPSVILEIRYFGSHNFIGKPIDGYQKSTAILSDQAIVALKKAAADIASKGMVFKIFDGYRPQRAVNHFVRWAKDEKDTLMKSEFYPDVAKKDLFELDYIASKSGHTRGSTLDLTLVYRTTGKEVDMGSPYDFFGKISWPFDTSITKKQQENRMLLREVMLQNGFKPYQCEWWHFTLNNEPYPDTYFDFPVE
ncbi:M15 family metallopeptidase [Flavicella marina]|uniref:M15 family metallopeptidase n=1 Tax=Flavicella marina TaxID=1475951 RepID=UPI001263FC56|nr:M15 family metallopeptidase [Flavicella marina]